MSQTLRRIASIQFVVAVLIGCHAASVWADKPKNRKEAATRAAAARRQKAINVARHQLSAGKAALSLAEAQASDARARLNAARDGLIGSRSVIESAQSDEHNSSAAMRSI